MKPSEIQLPHNFYLRSYQKEFWRSMMRKTKATNRACMVWHRRCGKDKVCWNFMITYAYLKRVGVYYYFFPTYSQGKKAIWDAIDKRGFRTLDHIPAELIQSKNETEMQIRLVNGSIIQIVGVDNMDSVMGTNPMGCVFSEYALQHASGWDKIRPILTENGGWSVFIYTPRRHNHGYHMAAMALKNTKWFYSLKTVEDTRRNARDENGKFLPGEDGQRIMDDQDIETERQAGMSEEMIQQEFYCSFDGGMDGSFYGSYLTKAKDEGRICDLPYNPSYGVETAWDIGKRDFTAIWFYQRIDHWIHIIDYFEDAGPDVSYYAKIIRDKPYTYTRHTGPHDLKRTGWAHPEMPIQVAANFGLYFDVLDKLPIQDGMDAAKRIFPICKFSASLCSLGLERLGNYRAKAMENELGQFYSDQAIKDDNAHGADAFRYLALAVRNPTAEQQLVTCITKFDVYNYEQGGESNDYDIFS